MNKHFAAAFAAVTLSVAAYAAPVVGDKVEYDRGRTFHLEFRVVEDTKEAHKILESRKDKKYPVSSGYELSKAAQAGKDVRFAACDLLVDVKVTGLTGGLELAREDYMVLGRGNSYLGATKAKVNHEGVTFENVKVKGGRTSIVVPHRFAKGGDPTVTVVAKGWKAAGAFQNGSVYTYPLSHRVFDNGDGVNVGMVIPMIAAAGSCP